jgi:hypothetical protein
MVACFVIFLPVEHGTGPFCAMPRDFLKGTKDQYDVVVIGSGLGGLPE